jgi:hypothetical protein
MASLGRFCGGLRAFLWMLMYGSRGLMAGTTSVPDRLRMNNLDARDRHLSCGP